MEKTDYSPPAHSANIKKEHLDFLTLTPAV